jgi:hypothetical protein
VDELDQMFGPPIRPLNGLKSWEDDERLLRYELNQASARQLSKLLSTAAEGGFLLSIATAVTIIWVVTERGDMVFALEETIEVGGKSRRPRMRGVPLDGTVKPLGHPLLVDGATARIAGELRLDTTAIDGQLVWILNNRSGRYGLHNTRTQMHLENVAELLRRYGIPVETEFFEVTT